MSVETLDSVRDLVFGKPENIERLAKSGPEKWVPLVEYLLESPTPSPSFVATLWQANPDIEAWFKTVERALSAASKFVTLSRGKKIIFAWFRESLMGAFPSHHPALLEMRILDLQMIARDDGGFTDAKLIFEQIAAQDPKHPRLGELALLVTKGAFTTRDYDSARRHATKAFDAFQQSGDHQGANLAARHLAGALLHQRQWEAGLRILDEAMTAPGPKHTGVTVTTSTTSAAEQVIDEAQMVSLWASQHSPEWVRALGALVEVFSKQAIGPELERRYLSALKRIAQGEDALDRIDIVIRQLRQRSFHLAAATAAEVCSQLHPKNARAHSMFAHISRDLGDHQTAYTHYRVAAELLEGAHAPDAAHAWMNVGDIAATLGLKKEIDAAFTRARDLVEGDAERRELEFFIARSMKKRDPKTARAHARALFRELRKEPQLLAESELGLATVDLLLDLLIADRDSEAIEVQQSLINAKLKLWNECPSVWLERHNLGTIQAKLGNVLEARHLIEGALGKLQSAFGDDHPNVELCKQSLDALIP